MSKRKHPRLDHYDYSTAGAYFITICTQSRQCMLSRIVGRGLAPVEIQYTTYGQIAQEQLLLLEQRYPSLKIDQYVIMPNHIHAILLLEETAGASPRPTVSVHGKQSIRLSAGCKTKKLPKPKKIRKLADQSDLPVALCDFFVKDITLYAWAVFSAGFQNSSSCITDILML